MTTDFDTIEQRATERLTEANAALEEARQRADEEAKRADAEAKELEKLEAELKARREAADAARIAKLEAEKAIAEAEKRARYAEADLPQERVTIEVATLTANRVLDAFDRFRGDGKYSEQPRESLQESTQRFWDVIDAARDRLLTSEVDDDARQIVLCCEGVIHACERWEADVTATTDPHEVSSPMGDCPADQECRHVAKFERDLRRCVAGESPNVILDRAGDLIRERLSFEQIAKTLTFVRPNGSICYETLALYIDTADRKATREFVSVHWLGGRTFETAWQRRQMTVDSRRKRRNESFAASSHGIFRPNRHPYAGPASEADPITESVTAYANRFANS
ncbi:hypothetical protein LOC71_22140 [Rhodopirellula sp. JC740]|uniref:Uncharacterized protein n=1 Tax=Rhodopirellula halodulae TaxID=2894198 RepID=A0ABS8NN41_9BACT|nr:hypothetical protein [Rhodopirellula sp. JC740]MCC9644986.1 hypothetical protein [Rhodopirellula sp. JC740]